MPCPNRQSASSAGRKHADGCVGRQQADADGRNAHGQQGGDQGGLAPDAIAEMPEQSRPDGPREECQRKGRERLQHGRGRIAFGKEQPGKHQHRGRGVNIEIEELDGRADQARKQDAARLRRAGPGYRVEQCRDSSERVIPDISSAAKSPGGLSECGPPPPRGPPPARGRFGIDGVGRDAGAGR